MEIETAQRATELLQKIKVAKIQKNNFEKFEVNGSIMMWAKDETKFNVGEDIEKGNYILIQTMKDSAISYLNKYIDELEATLKSI